jgi:large subunit ribosomal protein L15
MPLYRRLAQRGFSNYPFKKVYQVINLGEIEKRFSDGETVSAATLIQKGLVKGTVPVKILGDGKFTKKLVFEIEALSASAKEKISKAGGSAGDAATVNPPEEQDAGV